MNQPSNVRPLRPAPRDDWLNEEAAALMSTISDAAHSSDSGPAFTSVPPSGEMTLDEMIERLIFIRDGASVLLLPTEAEERQGIFARASSYENMLKETAASITVVGNRRRPTLKEWLENRSRKNADRYAIQIGGPRYLSVPGEGPVVNLWSRRERDRRCAERGDLVHKFLSHIEYLIEDPASREKFLDWLAHCEQQPNVLPHYGWLFWTQAFGVGRNWLSGALSKVWPREVAGSVDLSALIERGFNGRLAGKRCAVVDEIHLSGSKYGKYEIEAKLRQLMTEPIRRINPKYGREYDETNSCRWVIFSNHVDALPIQQGDRRFEVVHNPEQAKGAEYYTELYRLLEDPELGDAIGLWLAERDISHFNPGERPRMTQDKAAVIEATTSPLKSDLKEILAEWRSDVICSSDAMLLIGMKGEDGAKREFGHAMREFGWHRFGRIIVNKSVEYVWCRGTVQRSKKDREKLVEAIKEYKAADWFHELTRDF